MEFGRSVLLSDDADHDAAQFLSREAGCRHLDGRLALVLRLSCCRGFLLDFRGSLVCFHRFSFSLVGCATSLALTQQFADGSGNVAL